MIIEGHQAFAAADADVAGDAFDAFVRSHLDDSFRLARLILRDAVEAEDATHDAFLAAWRNRRSLRDPSRIDAWFGRILVNACRERLRRRRSRPTEPMAAAEAVAVTTADPYRGTDERDALERAFGTLSPDQRIVVVLRFYRDLTIDQIAQIVSVPPGTVKSRLHHALRNLEHALGSAEAEMKR